MSISCKRLRELLSGLNTAEKESFKITLGDSWLGRAPGHTQGVACFGEYLVISNNQKQGKKGVGYISLCRKKPDGDDYEYVSRVEDLPENEPLRYGHPGGVQMFEHRGSMYVVVPFERPEKPNGDVFNPENYDSKGSEIRFYYIDEHNDFQFKYAGLTIKRENKKAGSVGVVKHDDDFFILAVAYNENAVDFYEVNLSDRDRGKYVLQGTLPSSSERPSYVNALSLLTCKDKNKSQENIYVVGLTDKESLYVFGVDFFSGGKLDSGLYINLRSKMGDGSCLYRPSFRWAGNCFLSEKEDRLSISIIVLKRSISEDDGTATSGFKLGSSYFL